MRRWVLEVSADKLEELLALPEGSIKAIHSDPGWPGVRMTLEHEDIPFQRPGAHLPSVDLELLAAKQRAGRLQRGRRLAHIHEWAAEVPPTMTGDRRECLGCGLVQTLRPDGSFWSVG